MPNVIMEQNDAGQLERVESSSNVVVALLFIAANSKSFSQLIFHPKLHLSFFYLSRMSAQSTYMKRWQAAHAVCAVGEKENTTCIFRYVHMSLILRYASRAQWEILAILGEFSSLANLLNFSHIFEFSRRPKKLIF